MIMTPLLQGICTGRLLLRGIENLAVVPLAHRLRRFGE